MDRTTEQQQLSHGVSESSETKKDSFVIVPQCEEPTLIQIGEILNGTYQITRVIAQGGMGIVYEGIDLFLHRKVAIKVLVTDIDSEDYEKELKLFQTEVNLCGNLLHPNIVQIYYAGTYHRLPYLVMEYIDGVPINEYMNKQRCCSWKKLARLIRNIAKGLAYIHKNNILHRDIKPSNILVTAQGMPILIDFGISIKKNLVGIETNDGELSGTIRYMSPEQVSGQNDQIDERSDIYSLGLILYEILTKRPAYTGSPNEVIGQIFNSSLLPPSEVNINIPESLSNITMKAIAKNVEDRYSTAEEFIEDLELYIKNVNNKPIKNKVPLWQKAFCYLKPNTATAISLIWIAFFFIIVAISPNSFREFMLNLPRHPIASISKLVESIPYLFKKQDPSLNIPKGNQNNIATEEPGEDDQEPPRPPYPPKDDSVITESTEEKTKITSQYQIAQNGQTNETNETAQQNLSDDNQPKSNNSNGLTHYNVMQDNPSDTPEQKEPEEKPNQDTLQGIDIKASEDRDFLPEPTNWEKFEIEFPPNYPIADPEDFIVPEPNSYIILDNLSYSNISLLSDKFYKVTASKNELTFKKVNFSSTYLIDINVNSYQKLWCLNESTIIGYPTDGIDHLDKIDLNNENNITRYDFSSNKGFGNINFDNGQFVKIKNDYYFLSYNPARLYLLHLEEPKLESDTQNGTIDVISSKNLDYSPIENTSIVVLNDTLYYLRSNFGWSGLRAVKVLVSGSEDEFQVQIENIRLIENIALTNSLLGTDNVNRIWIINTDGVIEYNVRTKKSQKISNDSYPVLYSSDSAVSFYSNGYLYCIVGEQADILQAFILYVGVSPKENIVANEFTQKDSISGKYPIFEFKDKYKFIWVNDSIQITLDKQNEYNNVFSLVTVGDKNTQKNWKKDVLKVKNDLNVIGIISKKNFRTYYSKIKNAHSYSVLISKEYYSLQDWLMCYTKNNNNNSEFEISYKGETIPVPCFTFWCISKKGTNKEVQVQDASKWYEDYKSELNPREIEQFNYLDEKGCEITVECRLMYIIPNE